MGGECAAYRPNQHRLGETLAEMSGSAAASVMGGASGLRDRRADEPVCGMVKKYLAQGLAHCQKRLSRVIAAEQKAA